jgi:hypothetical protein
VVKEIVIGHARGRDHAPGARWRRRWSNSRSAECRARHAAESFSNIPSLYPRNF